MMLSGQKLSKRKLSRLKRQARIWAHKYILANNLPLDDGLKNKHFLKALNDHLNPSVPHINLISVWTDIGNGVPFTKKELIIIKSTKVKKYKKHRETDIFYKSGKWQAIRFEALKRGDGCCVLCGRSKPLHGVILHVDHIKPRSLFPELELDIENLQVLCADCNLGKSNRDSTDWRKPVDTSDVKKEEVKPPRTKVIIRRKPNISQEVISVEICKCGAKTKKISQITLTGVLKGVECTGCGRRELFPSRSKNKE